MMNPPKFEQIWEFGNLLSSAKKALKSRWRYRKEAAEFRVNMAKELLKLQAELTSQTYHPLPYRTFLVHDPKDRLISAAPIRDRVVHHALIGIIGPWLERSFIDDTYACRVGKGTHRAIQKAQEYARKYQYFIHCDVSKFFDTIDHEILGKIVCKKITDFAIILLIEQIISHTAPGMPKNKSVPIGNLTSQYFGNLYLDSLDHFVKDRLGVKGYLRYMDDFLLFHDDKAILQDIAKQATQFTEERLKLKLSRSFINPVYSGIPFLGLRIFPNILRLQAKRWKRFKDKFREIQDAFLNEDVSQERFLSSVTSMVSHLDKANTWNLRGSFFEQYLGQRP